MIECYNSIGLREKILKDKDEIMKSLERLRLSEELKEKVTKQLIKDLEDFYNEK